MSRTRRPENNARAVTKIACAFSARHFLMFKSAHSTLARACLIRSIGQRTMTLAKMMSATLPISSEQKERPSVAFHICAWLGFPAYGALFALAAISAAGSPGANHNASSWNSIAWLWPIAGASVSIIAVAKSSSWIRRIFGAIPLVGYLAVIGYLISWTHSL
jgi:hypothetical protein